MIEVLLILLMLIVLIMHLYSVIGKHRKAIDILTDAHNGTFDECRSLRTSIRRLIEAGPTTCETCGGNLFVCPEDEWLCKSCRQPAPESFASKLDDPHESRMIN